MLGLVGPGEAVITLLCQLARGVVLVHPLKQAVKLRDPLLCLGQLCFLPGQLPPLFLGILVHHQPDKPILVRLDIGYRGLQMGQHQGRQHLLPDIVDGAAPRVALVVGAYIVVLVLRGTLVCGEIQLAHAVGAVGQPGEQPPLARL